MSDPKLKIEQEIEALRRSQAELRQLLQQEQDTLRDLAQRLWSQQEAERARLSRELHDGLGQLLTALTRRLQSAADSGAIDCEIPEIATQALDDVRQMSRLMRPRILDDLGLEAALHWLVRTLCEGSDVRTDVRVDIDTPVDSASSILVFRIAQEALTNCVRHANASMISLYASRAGTTLRLDVIDDGCGFDMDTVEQGVGLSSMRDRAAAFAADFEVRSRPGGGCHISVLVPL
ncbi:sensor histidine kinase [Aliidiomarina sanyensis]|uniref:Two-component sensor histidine kinase n=1 Tax=Aliidiomarina sanyensis TaxID=1249555 RepID=A0A432WFV6_9GAMM|nr:sensor histidine kinase [Aliidiomarina sanyensis]RUO32706.1 two-component sensor histidine kinase [Aliidiomarina sanyensis]